MNYQLTRFKNIRDERGDLVVFLRHCNLPKDHREFGQIYFVTFNEEGVVRGNHYHKDWMEWFGIVHGVLRVVLEDIHTKERVELVLDADKDEYVRLEIGADIAHAFQSLSPSAALLNYANGEWHPHDTFSYSLI